MTIKALTTLREPAAAAAVADALNLRVQGYQSVDLSDGSFTIAPMPRSAGLQMAAAIPAAGDRADSGHYRKVLANVILRPRQFALSTLWMG